MEEEKGEVEEGKEGGMEGRGVEEVEEEKEGGVRRKGWKEEEE